MRVGPADEAGLTKWDAVLPTEASVSMRAAMETLAAQYRADNPELTVAQSRADALVDLVLSDVQVSTTATLIIPTTSAPAASPSRRPDPARPRAWTSRRALRLARARPHRRPARAADADGGRPDAGGRWTNRHDQRPGANCHEPAEPSVGPVPGG